MELYQYLHEYKTEVSISSIIIGAILVTFSTMTIMADEAGTGAFSTIKDSFGGWIYWVIIIGSVVLLMGTFYFLDFLSKRREFYKLFNERSKSKFIKNLDRIEELAWRLHPKFEEMVIDRKKKMKIR